VSLDYSDTGVASIEITFSYQYHVVYETEPGSLASFVKKAAWGIIGGS
jgi:hypothetical protein